MDYSKLSDFEINKAVAIAQGFPPDDCDIAKLGSSLVGVEWNEDTGYSTKSFDYCNNPADAWPIIVENKLSIYPSGERWGVEGFNADDPFYFDDNPLRAAMTVFLMMQESANVQANPARPDIR